MLKKTFAKLHETFDALREEFHDAAKGADSVSIENGSVRVEIESGNVTITGSLKELRINGKRVRFSGKLPEEPT